jgi:hypothetical protein
MCAGMHTLAWLHLGRTRLFPEQFVGVSGRRQGWLHCSGLFSGWGWSHTVPLSWVMADGCCPLLCLLFMRALFDSLFCCLPSGLL